MIKALEKLFDKLEKPEKTEQLSIQELNLSIAALLIEVATIDQHLDEAELAEACFASSASAEASASEMSHSMTNKDLSCCHSFSSRCWSMVATSINNAAIDKFSSCADKCSDFLGLSSLSNSFSRAFIIRFLAFGELSFLA